MHALAQFDRLLAQAQARCRPASPSHPQAGLLAGRLIDPHGDICAEFASAPSDAQILAAAHRLSPGDWCGVLADDAAGGISRLAWRLALFRADRHGQPRLHREGQAIWLSAPLLSRSGSPAAELLRQLRSLAVQALWAAGWRFQTDTMARDSR